MLQSLFELNAFNKRHLNLLSSIVEYLFAEINIDFTKILDYLISKFRLRKYIAEQKESKNPI